MLLDQSMEIGELSQAKRGGLILKNVLILVVFLDHAKMDNMLEEAPHHFEKVGIGQINERRPPVHLARLYGVDTLFCAVKERVCWVLVQHGHLGIVHVDKFKLTVDLLFPLYT
jgi:hypothetical protein